MVLQWLVPFLTCEDYFRPCKRCRGPEADCAHQTIARDRQINFFATDTQNWMTACAHCRPELEQCGLYILQIRRSSHQDVVKIEDIQDLHPPSVVGVQAYTINGHRVAFLRTRPVPREARAGPMCVTCSRGIQEGSSYCSLECKLVQDLGNNFNELICPNVSEPGQSPQASPKSSMSSADVIPTSFGVSTPLQTQLGQGFRPYFSPSLTSLGSGEGSQLSWPSRKRRKMACPKRSPS